MSSHPLYQNSRIQFDCENSLKHLGQKASRIISSITHQATSQLQHLSQDYILQESFNESCQTSDAEIESYSLLNRSSLGKEVLANYEKDRHASPCKKAVSILVNFLGGGLLTGGKKSSRGELDGLHSPADNFMLWGALLTDVLHKIQDKVSPEVKILENIIAGIHNLHNSCQEIEAFADKNFSDEELYHLALGYTEKVSKLQRGQSEVIYSGYTNIGGGGAHALIVEMTRRIDDDDFDLLLMTSTGFSLTDNLLTDVKIKLKPIVRFPKIPQHVLLMNEDGILRPGFIQSIIELRVLAKKDLNRVVNNDHVAEIFSCLNHQFVPLEEAGAISGQEGGTCLPSVTKVFIRHHSNHLALHKQLMFHTKLTLSVWLFNELSEVITSHDDDARECRYMLGILARKILRRSHKLISGVHGFGALISAETALEARATAHDILRRIEQAETKISLLNANQSETFQQETLATKKQRQRRISHRVYPKWGTTPLTIKPIIVPDFTLKIDLRTKTSENFFQTIEKVIAKAKSVADFPASANFQINSFIDQIPLGKKAIETHFWNKFTKAELREAQTRLTDLMFLYTKTHLADLLTRRFTTAMTFQVLVHRLALMIEAENGNLLPDAKIALYKIQSYTDALEIEGLQFYDRKEFIRLQEASKYIKEYNREGDKKAPLFINEGRNDVEKREVSNNPSNGLFWHALLASDLQLLDNVKKRAEDAFPDLTFEQIESAYQNKLSEYNQWLLKGLKSEKIEWLSLPHRQVNLPLDTKLTSMMEGYTYNSILDNSTYVYIDKLRFVNYITRQIMYNGTYNYYQNFRKWSARILEYTYKVVVKCLHEDQIQLSPKLQTLDFEMDLSLEKEHSDYLLNGVASRNIENWKRDIAEGHSLKFIEPKETLLYRLTRTLSQWRLSPLQMIYELEKDYRELTNPSLQGVIFKLFFRSPIRCPQNVELKEDNKEKKALTFIDNDHDIELGAGDFILQDQAFYDNAKDFVHKGLAFFFNSQNGMDGARFFFRLSYHLSKYLADAGDYDKAEAFNQTSEIERWFEKSQLTGSEKSTLYYYKVLFYSTKEKLSNEEIADAYASRMLYKIYPSAEQKWHSPYLEQKACLFILELTGLVSTFTGNLPLISELGDRIFKKLNLHHGYISSPWKIDVTLGFPYLVHENWKIDLANGKVYSDVGEVQGVAKNFPWEKSPSFKRLFGEGAHLEYKLLGIGYITFTHPTKGTYLLEESHSNPSETERTYLIKRKMPGFDVWFIYEHKPIGFPSPLSQDHAFWLPEEKCKNITGFITSLDSQNIVYVLLLDGTIVETDERGNKRPNGLVIDYLETNDISQENHDSSDLEFKGEPSSTTSSSSTSPVSNEQTVPLGMLIQFESAENILIKKAANGNFERMSFSRYISQDNNPLMLISHQGKMVWIENREYALSFKKPTSLLGTLKNYIYLKSTKPANKNKGVIILPLQKIIYTKSKGIANDIVALDIANVIPMVMPLKDQKEKELAGTQRYLVMEVEEGRIKPTSFESKLFLAYIYLSQRRYEEAVNLLKSQKASDKLSPIGDQILEMIQIFPEGEDHPDFTMVQLHALQLVIREKDSRARHEMTEYFTHLQIDLLQNHLKNFSTLYKKLNNISINCRFSITEEQEIVSKILNEAKDKVNELSAINPKFDHENLFNILKRRLLHLGNPNQPHLGLSRSAYNPIKFNLTNRPYLVNTLGDEQLAHPEIVSKVVSWLNEGLKAWAENGASKYPYTQPIHAPDGKLFVHVYSIAMSDQTAKKSEMLFRLSMWSKFSKNSDSILTCCLWMLRAPEAFDKKQLEHLTNLEKYQFLKNAEEACISLANSPSRTIQKPFSYAIPIHKSAGLKTCYPVIQETISFSNVQKVTDIKPNKIPLEIDLTPPSSRWITLTSMREHFLEIDKAPQLDQAGRMNDFSFQFDASLLKGKEKSYTDSLKIDLENLQRDYDAGKALNLTYKQKVISPENVIVLKSQAEQRLSEVKKDRKEKEDQLLQLVNITSSDAYERESKLARVGGHIDSLLNFQDCVNALLSCDERFYLIKNKHLKDSQTIKRAAVLTLEVLDLKSYEAQLGRIIKTARDIEEIDKPQQLRTENSATRRYLCAHLEIHLETTYHFEKFSDDEQVALRVFAGQSGIVPFKKQTDLLHKMLEFSEKDPERYQDIVIQLMMGGGKTAVIALLLLYLSSRRKDRMAFFIVPHALLNTVSANLGEAMPKAFGKEIISIDMVREDFTLYKIQRLRYQLDHAKEHEFPIIISAHTLQGLELELLSQTRRQTKLIKEIHSLDEQLKAQPHLGEALVKAIKTTRGHLIKNMEALAEKCLKIDQILEITSREADGLIDEVDLILDSFQEVNYVDGDKENVDPLRHQMLLILFKVMLNEDLRIETLEGHPSITEVVRLQSNQQTLMSQHDYSTHIAPLLARNLARKFQLISADAELYLESYVRFATDQMPWLFQEFADSNLHLTEQIKEQYPELAHYSLADIQNDVAFIKHLERLYHGEETQREIADLISLSKHFISELFITTLTKKGDRKYGPSQTGKIIPYNGVKNPAKTEFGYHWESGCYHYQYGSAFKPQKKQILDLAHMATVGARYYVQKYGERFEETAEAQEFLEIFNVKLDQIRQPGKIDEAIAFISKDTQKLLEMQYDLVARYATFATERITSNGLALLSLLNSKRGMSGTPWSVEGYPEELSKQFEADLGTEGRVLHRLATLAPDKKIYQVDFENCVDGIKDFLQQIRAQHPHFRKIRGIIEAGGLFQIFGSNANVAKGWMEFIHSVQVTESLLPDDEKTVDPAIEGVLFFHHDLDEVQPNTLYVWRKEASSPDWIKFTMGEKLDALGLNPKNYVVYYDDSHTTGTDLLQLPDVINLATFDEHMMIRTKTQSDMRLRQYFFEQSTDFVTNIAASGNFIKGGRTAQDLIMSAAKYQSIRKTQSMVHYFQQQVHHIFRHEAAKKLRELLRKKQYDMPYALEIDHLEKFIVTFYKEEPYLQFGRLLSMTNTKEMLKDLLSRKIDYFKSLVTDEVMIESVEQKAAGLRDWIDQSRCLPTEWKQISNQLGVQQEVEQEINVEIEVKTENEVENEIEIELQHYEEGEPTIIATEEPMLHSDFQSLVKALRTDTEQSSQIVSLKKQLQTYLYKFPNKKTDYHEAFNAEIYGTLSYFYTCKNLKLLSVFHPLQRPAKQILVVRTDAGKLRWLLISEFEANEVRSHLNFCYGSKPAIFQDIWLVQPNGTLLVTGEDLNPFPYDEEEVLMGLTEINAFTGNIDYLDSDNNRETTEEWLSKDPELKVRFLKLRTLRNQFQHQLLRASISIAEACGKNVTRILGCVQHMCQKRQELERNKLGRFRVNQKWETKLLNSKKNISDLNVLFVPFLGIDWEKRDSDDDTRTALDHLKKTMKILNDQQLKSAAEEITRKQFNSLNVFQGPFITIDQIQWLPQSKVAYLTKPNQIIKDIALADGSLQRVFMLSREQARGLKDTQAHLIPVINPDYYADFNQHWQIKGVPTVLLAKINPALGYMLSHSQIDHLSVAFGPLLDLPHPSPSDREKVGILQRIISSFSPEQCKIIHGDFIELIPTKYHHLITPSQVKQITKSLLIVKLETIRNKDLIQEGLWTSWINSAMVRYVVNEKIQYLITKELIEQVGTEQYSGLDPTQVKFLTHQQLLYIKDFAPHWQRLLEAMKGDLIRTFNSTELISLCNQQQLSDFLIAEQVKLLVTPSLIQNCPSRLIHLLNNEQVSHISPNQVPYIFSQLIPLIPQTAEHVAQLSKQQLRYATETQAKLFTPQQIQQMGSLEEISLLTTNQWVHLSAQGFAVMNRTQVETLQHRNELLTNIQYVNPAIIDTLTNLKAIEHLAVNQIELFGSDGFNQLIAHHPLWKRITPHTIQDLNFDKVDLLTKDQLRHLKKVETIKKLSQFDFVYLTKEQLKHRKWSFLTYVVGVIALVVVICHISLIASIALYFISKINDRSAKRYKASIDLHIKRLPHLFFTYLPALVS